MSAKELSSAPAPLAYGTPEQLVRDFASRGLVVLAPENLGIPLEVHERIYQRVAPELLPDMPFASSQPATNWSARTGPLCRSPIMRRPRSALAQGRRQPVQWPQTAAAPSRANRNVYYPQAVREDMGPMATMPYSHYWTFNHDNFAGPTTQKVVVSFGLTRSPARTVCCEAPSRIARQLFSWRVLRRIRQDGMGYFAPPFELCPLN